MAFCTLAELGLTLAAERSKGMSSLVMNLNSLCVNLIVLHFAGVYLDSIVRIETCRLEVLEAKS